MERKLVQQGISTLMLSVPSKWVKNNNLQKGSTVNLEVLEDKIFITPEKNDKKRKVELNLISNTESSIRTLITNAYRSGYDTIIIKFDNQDQFKTITDVVTNNLFGFEIANKYEKSCVVENVAEPTEEQFELFLNKIFMAIENMINITSKRFEGEEFSIIDIQDTTSRIQRYDNFCRRTITKQRFLNGKSEFYWAFLTLLIHGQRELYYLNENFQGKIKIQNKIKEYLSDLQNIFMLIKDAYNKKDVSLLSKIHDLEKDLIYKKGYDLLENSDKKERLVIYHLMASIRQFYQANSPLNGILS